MLSVFESAVAGDRRALARGITYIEDRRHGVLEAMDSLSPRRGQGPGAPHVLGFTGPPGAGKSTLVDQVVSCFRAQEHDVGVVAVDPTSPFSGGAVLGDRLRMEDHVGDPGVFIRSVANRGSLGGLSPSAGQVVDLLDACGFDRVIVETVGVGQSELSVMTVVDTVVVVLTPESGDVVQGMKAGLLEAADIFVVNKADRDGAMALQRVLEEMVRLDGDDQGWMPPVVLTTASRSQGLDPLMDAISAHRDWLMGDGRVFWQTRRQRGRQELFFDLVALHERHRVAAEPSLAHTRRQVADGAVSPYRAAQELQP